MIGFDEAAAIACAAARPLGRERVALRAAAGRVLAGAVLARRDSPPFAASSMDGYAVRETDVSAAPAILRVVGESYPGAAHGGMLGPGECVRVFTGAPAPLGCDRVVIQEDVVRDGDCIRLCAVPIGARFLRARGSDFRSGEVLLQPGWRLGPGAMVAAAAADIAEIDVFRRPKVVVLSTGDELAEPGTAGETPGAIPDSASFGVAAMIGLWGGEVVRIRRLRDERPAMEAAAEEALEEADLVVATGGASAGEKDFAKAMFAPTGLELLFAKVAIKPGKPAWLGRARDRLVLGLPGNPTSALVTARLFLAPLLAGLGGLDPTETIAWRAAATAAPLDPVGDRETFLRGRRAGEAVEPLDDQDSGAQKALAEARVLIRRPAGAPLLGAGEQVRILDL